MFKAKKTIMYIDVSCGDKDHKKCEYQLRLENYDLGGIARDFELLKKAGIIEHVTKPTNYIVL